MKSHFIRLKQRMEEASIVEPNDFGFSLINNLYRSINQFFKKTPFIMVIPTSFLIVIFFYILFGFLAVKLVNILQNGF